jgi:hypothetical protein
MPRSARGLDRSLISEVAQEHNRLFNGKTLGVTGNLLAELCSAKSRRTRK